MIENPIGAAISAIHHPHLPHIPRSGLARLALAAAIPLLSLQSSASPQAKCYSHAFFDEGVILFPEKSGRLGTKLNFPYMTRHPASPGHAPAYIHSFAPGASPSGYYMPVYPLFDPDGVLGQKPSILSYDRVAIGGSRISCYDNADTDYVEASSIEEVEDTTYEPVITP